jgi:hypothetical protein
MKIPFVVWVGCLAAIVCSGLPAATHAAPGASAQCGDPKSQAGYFLSVIREIVLNGDLTDRKSLETILETKFDAHPDTAGALAGHRTEYTSHTLFGRPADVDYSYLDDPATQKKWGWIAALKVNLDPSWPSVSPEAVEACFEDVGKDRPLRILNVDGGRSSWMKPIPRMPPGGGKLRITWSYSRDRNHVDLVGIYLDP